MQKNSKDNPILLNQKIKQLLEPALIVGSMGKICVMIFHSRDFLDNGACTSAKFARIVYKTCQNLNLPLFYGQCLFFWMVQNHFTMTASRCMQKFISSGSLYLEEIT
jgi:hypothetical protein